MPYRNAVLWIRIRKKPEVLAGSESEKKFGFGHGFGFRHCCGMKNLVKIADQPLEREKKLCFSIGKFFLWRTGQVPEHIWKQLEAPFGKIWGQHISLRIRIRIRNKKFVNLNPKKLIRIHNTAGTGTWWIIWTALSYLYVMIFNFSCTDILRHFCNLGLNLGLYMRGQCKDHSVQYSCTHQYRYIQTFL
jgi:hypothetical protein